MSKKSNQITKDGLILIGLGDRSLAELLEEVNQDPEKMHELAYLSIKEVPHYRTFTASSMDQQEAFVKYLDMIKQYVGEEITNE